MKAEQGGDIKGFHKSVRKLSHRLSHREWPFGLLEIKNIILPGFGDGARLLESEPC